MRPGTGPIGVLKRFLRDEHGAVTVDWVVLSATIMTVSLTAFGPILGGVVAGAMNINSSLAAIETGSEGSTSGAFSNSGAGSLGTGGSTAASAQSGSGSAVSTGQTARQIARARQQAARAARIAARQQARTEAVAARRAAVAARRAARAN